MNIFGPSYHQGWRLFWPSFPKQKVCMAIKEDLNHHLSKTTCTSMVSQLLRQICPIFAFVVDGET